MNDLKWNQKEKSISQVAFDKAYRNECEDIIKTVRQKLNNLSEPKKIWELEEYLYKKRKEIDNKYDYRYLVLITVFSRLIAEGWIKIKDLEELGEEKIERIKLLTGMDI